MLKSDLTNRIKHSFFQVVVVSILLYGCTAVWTLTKCMKKKLPGISNKSWRQHPTKQQLYGLLPAITKTIQVRQAKHAGPCWRSRDKLTNNILQWTTSHGRSKTEWPAWTYIEQLCVYATCSLEVLSGAMDDKKTRDGRGSERSVMVAWHDHDHDDDKDYFVTK